MTEGIIQRVFKNAVLESEQYMTPLEVNMYMESIKQELIEKIREGCKLGKVNLCKDDCEECKITKLIVERLIGDRKE